MTVRLIRYHLSSQGGLLDPATGNVEIVPRVPNSRDGSLGRFDYLSGALVALYHEPAAPDVLWLQFGGSRWPFTDETRSAFSPDIPNDEPSLENADVARTFRLFDASGLLFEHTYALHDREERLRGGMDPFPSWPDEEENYDILYFVHRILPEGRWKRV